MPDGPRWRPNREIAWHIQRLLLHVRYAKRLKYSAFSFVETQLFLAGEGGAGIACFKKQTCDPALC